MSSPPTTRRYWPTRPPPDHRVGWARTVHDVSELPAVRADLREYLRSAQHTTRGGELHEAAERLLLAADEMTANGVRHGRRPVLLEVARTDDHGVLLAVVTDRAPADAPTPDPTRDPALGGLGLSIVVTCAQDHGWWPDDVVKHVWATLPVR